MISLIISICSEICPVAVGSISGESALKQLITSRKFSVYFCAISMGSNCSNFAFFTILSSPSSASFSRCPTSVIFLTYLTLYPKNLKYLTIVSKKINVLQLPRCTSLYTVGPQTYTPMKSLCIGTNFSFLPVRLFLMYIVLFISFVNHA